MVPLKQTEIEWLRENFPKLFYSTELNHLSGLFEFTAKFNNRYISDCYSVFINLNYGSNYILPKLFCELLPKVYVTDDRLRITAKLLKLQLCDLHVNDDGSQCLIRPDKIYSIYRNHFFDIKVFMQHLVSHFYWQSHMELYREQPWAGEEHGYNWLVNYGR